MRCSTPPEASLEPTTIMATAGVGGRQYYVMTFGTARGESPAAQDRVDDVVVAIAGNILRVRMYEAADLLWRKRKSAVWHRQLQSSVRRSPAYRWPLGHSAKTPVGPSNSKPTSIRWILVGPTNCHAAAFSVESLEVGIGSA